jgi:hypothetical protein
MGSEFVELYRITDFETKYMDFKAVISLVLTFAVSNFATTLLDLFDKHFFPVLECYIQFLFH